MVHSESRQKVTLLGGSLILDRARSPNLVPRTKPFISILGTVMPVRGVTLALERRLAAKVTLDLRSLDQGPGLSWTSL